MKSNISTKLIALLLSLGMLTSYAPTLITASDSDPSTPAVQNTEAAATQAEEPNKDLIEYANSLANVSQAYLSSDRKTATIKNSTMSLDYDLRGNSNTTFVSNMTNTKGQSYITDTMDVFVEMNGGNKFALQTDGQTVGVVGGAGGDGGQNLVGGRARQNDGTRAGAQRVGQRGKVNVLVVAAADGDDGRFDGQGR